MIKNDEEAQKLMAQYKTFNELRLFFAKIVWSTPAIFVGFMVISFSSFEKLHSLLLKGFVFTVTGCLFCLIAYTTKKHIDNENYYTDQFNSVAKKLNFRYSSFVEVEHRSGKISSRKLMVLIFYIVGVSLIFTGAVYILWK